jgi:hypothetical protein
VLKVILVQQGQRDRQVQKAIQAHKGRLVQKAIQAHKGRLEQTVLMEPMARTEQMELQQKFLQYLLQHHQVAVMATFGIKHINHGN